MCVFETATAITTPSKTKKAKKEATFIGADLDAFAACAAVTKALKDVQAVFENKVKGFMGQLFVHNGLSLKTRPENFTGVGANSSASCQLKSLSTSATLAPEVASYLLDKGIELEEKVIQEESYSFNPAALADPILRAKIAAVLGTLDTGGITLIEHREKKTGFSLTDTSLDSVFMLAETEEEAEKLLPLVSTLAIRPKFEGSLREAFDIMGANGVAL